MFTTTIAVFALSSVTALGANSQPAWHTDYRAAIAHATELHKPVAVFIAKTPGDVLRVVPAVSQRVLRSEYVALIVSTETEAGSKLAASFEMAEGLVISDYTGTLQALRVEGTIASPSLVQTLERFADPNRQVRKTESVPAVTITPQQAEPVMAPTINPAPVYTPAYTPAAYSAPPMTLAPQMVTPTYAPAMTVAAPRIVTPTYAPPMVATTTVCRT